MSVVKSLPVPLKSFDCFTCIVHVASRPSTVDAHAHVRRDALRPVSAVEVERNSTTLPAGLTVHPVRRVVAPGGGVYGTTRVSDTSRAVKFADPSVCLLFVSFVSLSLSSRSTHVSVDAFSTSTVAS